nr:hypothetical protein [Tanacetum cinerariifolium]
SKKHLPVVIGKSVVLVDLENPQSRRHALKRLVMHRKVKSAFADSVTTFKEALARLKKKNQNGLQNTMEPGKDTLGLMLRKFEKPGRLTNDDDDGLLQLRPKKMDVNIQKYEAYP